MSPYATTPRARQGRTRPSPLDALTVAGAPTGLGRLLETVRFSRNRGVAARGLAEALRSEALKRVRTHTSQSLCGARRQASAKGQGPETLEAARKRKFPKFNVRTANFELRFSNSEIRTPNFELRLSNFGFPWGLKTREGAQKRGVKGLSTSAGPFGATRLLRDRLYRFFGLIFPNWLE